MSHIFPDNHRIFRNQQIKTTMGKHLLEGIMPKDTGEIHLYPQIFVNAFDARIEPETPFSVTIYISDFYDTVYTYDAELYFDVRVEIDREVEIHNNIRGGNYTVNFGILPEGEYTISFQVIDSLGRKSQRIFYDILVRSYYIAPEDTYTMTLEDLTTYNITLGLTFETATEVAMKNNRLGIYNLVHDKASEGYKKIIFLNGIYRVRQTNRDYLEPDNPHLIMPSNFTIDLNGATIKLHPYLDKDFSTNMIVRFDDSFDSHIINGTIEGDWDERLNFQDEFSDWEGETAMAIGFNGGKSKFCSLRNVTVKLVTGYNIGSGIGGAVLEDIGDLEDNKHIDENTGEEFYMDGYVSTTYKDITSFLDSGQIACNYWLGYGGVRGEQIDMWFSFYDENYNFIEQIQIYQHRRCQIPLGSKFMRTTVKGLAEEVSELSLHSHSTPKGTAFIDCHWERNRTCVAFGQFQHIMMKNCTFFDSGHSITPSAIDIEDGWEQAQDFFLVDCDIQSQAGTADLIINAGLNHHMVNNNNFRMLLRSGIRGLAVHNNNNCSLGSGKGGITGYNSRFYNNDLTSIGFSEWGENPKIEPYQLIKNKTLSTVYVTSAPTAILGGKIELGIHSNLDCIASTISKHPNAEWIGHYNDGNNNFRYCRFIGTNEYPIYTVHGNNSTRYNNYYECVFYAPTELINHNYFYVGLWSECTFMETLSIKPHTIETVMGSVKFEYCVFEKHVTYNTAKIQFNNCIFKQGATCTGVSQAQFNNCTGV